MIKKTTIQEMLNNDGQWVLRLIKQEYSDSEDVIYFVETSNYEAVLFRSLEKAQEYFERRRVSIQWDQWLG